MANRPGEFKDIELPTLDGLFDSRTPSGLVGFGNFRVVLNMDATKEKSRCRLGGWTKFLSDSPYGFKNQDFHDQMLDCLTYRDTIEQDVFIAQTVSGFAYPYWYPSFTTGETVSHSAALGPFQAYQPIMQAAYPSESAVVPGQWFLCDVTLGTPYTVDATPDDSVYWNPNDNLPPIVVPEGSNVGGSGFQHTFSDGSTLTASNNLQGPGKVTVQNYQSNSSNPNNGLSAALIAWWKSESYADLVAERINLPVPKVVTSVKFYWEWVDSSHSPGWDVVQLYNSGGDSAFSSYTPQAWTLSMLWTEADAAVPPVAPTPGFSTYSLCRDTINPSTSSAAYGYGPYKYSYTDAYTYNYEGCYGYVYHRQACREVITMIRQVSTVAGRRKFLVGTKSKIAVLEERGGNWRILADGLGGPYSLSRNCGCPSDRFKVATLGNIVVLTNNVDPVLFWAMDAGPLGCDGWSVDYVQDLLTLNITRAKVTASWRGFLFIANVEQDGARYSNRLFWSDYNDPLSWFPGNNTLSFTQDLADGDRIVAMETIGQQLRIYTRRGANETAIYDVMVVGGTETFNFQEIYRGPDGLQYENSMVNRGDAHYWVSESGVMEIGAYDRTPNRIEWMHRASGALYDGVSSEWLGPLSPFALSFSSGAWVAASGFSSVNKDACDMVNGFYDSSSKALWFSWPTGSAVCPTMSIRFNIQYRTASLVDHGFTAGCMMRPDYVESLRMFMAEFGGCNPASLLMAKEGMPYSFVTPGSVPAYIRNATEDPSLPASPDSICARLGETLIDDFCAQCDSDSVLVMADAQDRTLKQFTPDVYYRERYIGGEEAYSCPYTSPGNYAQDGYFSLLQSDADKFKQDVEKIVNRTKLDFVAEDQVPASELSFEIAYGSQPRCLTWDQTSTPRELTCLTNESAAEHLANNTRPDTMATYNFYRRGVYIAWRAYTSGTGGASCWNNVTLKMRLGSGNWL